MIEGQFKDYGKGATRNLFVGGVLVPEDVQPAIVYNKLNVWAPGIGASPLVELKDWWLTF